MPEVKFNESVRIAGISFDESKDYVEVPEEVAKIALKAGFAEPKGAKAAPVSKSKGGAPENK